MFFAIEFFLAIASYKFSENDLIFIDHGIIFLSIAGSCVDFMCK